MRRPTAVVPALTFAAVALVLINLGVDQAFLSRVSRIGPGTLDDHTLVKTWMVLTADALKLLGAAGVSVVVLVRGPRAARIGFASVQAIAALGTAGIGALLFPVTLLTAGACEATRKLGGGCAADMGGPLALHLAAVVISITVLIAGIVVMTLPDRAPAPMGS
jgi:hypothetical protein